MGTSLDKGKAAWGLGVSARHGLEQSFTSVTEELVISGR